MSVFFDLKRKCFHNTALLLVIFWQGCNIFASVLPWENLSAGFFAQVIAYKLWSHRTNAALIKENEFASSEDRKNHSLLFIENLDWLGIKFFIFHWDFWLGQRARWKNREFWFLIDNFICFYFLLRTLMMVADLSESKREWWRSMLMNFPRESPAPTITELAPDRR